MRSFFFAVLILALLLSGGTGHAVAASPSGNNIEEQSAQLDALTAYITRMSSVTNYEKLSNDEMQEIIEDGISWILESQDENGHFRYEYVPYENRYLDDDNIVRQGGALYALGEVYRKQTKKDQSLGQGIERAISYFEDLSKEGEKGDTSFRCVVNFEGSRVCKLGATALVLIGILGYVEGNPDERSTYEPLIEDYLAYILASQKDEGGFSNTYRIGRGFSEEESPFSNGEALLALVRGYQYESHAATKASIDAAFTYLEKKDFDTALYLWIMAALKDMQTLWPQQAYVDYTKEFTAWRLAHATRIPRDRNYCAYIEGVASALGVVEKGPEPTLWREELDRFNAYHKELQIDENDLYRVVTGGNGALSLSRAEDIGQGRGGFLTAHSVPTQRIDFTQHCVSAYLQTLVDIDNAEL